MSTLHSAKCMAPMPWRAVAMRAKTMIATAAGGTEAGVDDEPRHPLPRSAEARPDQIPEREEREKGFGEDIEAKVQAKAVAVDPDGRPYPSGQSDR